MVSFSQPVCPDHMLLGSQLLGTPGASQVDLAFYNTTIKMAFVTQIEKKTCCCCCVILRKYKMRIQQDQNGCFLMGLFQNPWQRLIRRLTRITTALSAEEASKDLKAVCISLGHTWKQTCTNQVRSSPILSVRDDVP